MSDAGIRSALQHDLAFTQRFPRLLPAYITDDYDPPAAERHPDGTPRFSMKFWGIGCCPGTHGAEQPHYKLLPNIDVVPRSTWWHERAHHLVLVILNRVGGIYDVGLYEDAFRIRCVPADVTTRIAGSNNLQANEQFCSMLPEAFFGEWGGYTMVDPAVDPLNYPHSATAAAMRAFYLGYETWAPSPELVERMKPRITMPPSPAPAAPPTPAAAYADIRGELARADFEIGRSTIRIGLAFHHTGSPGLDTSDPLRALQILARYHRAKDWSAQEGVQAGDGLMYHFAIAGGRVYLCRDIDAVLYATGTDANRTKLHCLFLNDPPGPGDYAAARGLIRLQGVAPSTHRAEGTSTCPGDEISAWVESYSEEEEMDRTTFNAWFREQYLATIDPTIESMKAAYNPCVVYMRENGLLDAAQEAAIAEALARLERIAEAARG
jgi:hypothetical protein